MPYSPSILFVVSVGLASWLVPGAGYLMLNEKKRAIIIFVTITLTFCAGLYAGSIGVVDQIGSKIAYTGQILNTPLVALLGRVTAGGSFPVYGRPGEIGQIYTTISGMLNLLCIVNAVYTAYLRRVESCGRI